MTRVGCSIPNVNTRSEGASSASEGLPPLPSSFDPVIPFEVTRRKVDQFSGAKYMRALHALDTLQVAVCANPLVTLNNIDQLSILNICVQGLRDPMCLSALLDLHSLGALDLNALQYDVFLISGIGSVTCSTGFIAYLCHHALPCDGDESATVIAELCNTLAATDLFEVAKHANLVSPLELVLSHPNSTEFVRHFIQHGFSVLTPSHNQNLTVLNQAMYPYISEDTQKLLLQEINLSNEQHCDEISEVIYRHFINEHATAENLVLLEWFSQQLSVVDRDIAEKLLEAIVDELSEPSSNISIGCKRVLFSPEHRLAAQEVLNDFRIMACYAATRHNPQALRVILQAVGEQFLSTITTDSAEGQALRTTFEAYLNEAFTLAILCGPSEVVDLLTQRDRIFEWTHGCTVPATIDNYSEMLSNTNYSASALDGLTAYILVDGLATRHADVEPTFVRSTQDTSTTLRALITARISTLRTNNRQAVVQSITKNVLDYTQKGMKYGSAIFVAHTLAQPLINYPPFMHSQTTEASSSKNISADHFQLTDVFHSVPLKLTLSAGMYLSSEAIRNHIVHLPERQFVSEYPELIRIEPSLRRLADQG